LHPLARTKNAIHETADVVADVEFRPIQARSRTSDNDGSQLIGRALAVFDRSLLSRTWRSADAGRAECRVHAERWLGAGSTTELIVPSAVVPEAYDSGEFNVVLNPLHTDFARATFEDPIPLDVDVRLQPVVSPLPSQPRRRRGVKVK
jgi:RES domain-containing protein